MYEGRSLHIIKDGINNGKIYIKRNDSTGRLVNALILDGSKAPGVVFVLFSSSNL